MVEIPRSRTRIPFNAKVILHSKAYHYPQDAVLTDISYTGAYIKTEDLVPVGYDCVIDILLTGASSKLTISIEGRIVRRDKNGLGIKFNDDVASWTLLPLFARYGSGNNIDNQG
jgi:hypothetical protein